MTQNQKWLLSPPLAPAPAALTISPLVWISFLTMSVKRPETWVSFLIRSSLLMLRWPKCCSSTFLLSFALQWLPVSLIIDFKILWLVFKARNGQAPAFFFPDLLTPYKPDRCLRLSSRALLMVPKARLVTKGDPSFAARAPQLWNSCLEILGRQTQ